MPSAWTAAVLQSSNGSATIWAAVIAVIGSIAAGLLTLYVTTMRQAERVARLEADLIFVLTTTKKSNVVPTLIKAFVDGLATEYDQGVRLSDYLRRVQKDELLRRMAEVQLTLETLATPEQREAVKTLFEDVKKGISGEAKEKE